MACLFSFTFIEYEKAISKGHIPGEPEGFVRDDSEGINLVYMSYAPFFYLI